MTEVKYRLGVVIPAYKVSRFILPLIERIGSNVERIFVVDDCCPEGSGRIVADKYPDSTKVRVLFHDENQGVGAALVTGYQEALRSGLTVIVKLDGDGQMDPDFIPSLVRPILAGRADYTKGNRFFRLESLKGMPPARVFGNAILSFVSKITNGYWNVMDPTNGFTAIHSSVLSLLPLDKLEKRYFFENDMLFRLSTVRAVVQDVPMDSVYGDEISNLKIGSVLREFPPKFLSRFLKRIFYNYFLRDFNLCSVELIFGYILLLLGVLFGLSQWFQSGLSGTPASAGTVMLAALPIVIGLNLLIAAISYDISNTPKDPMHLVLIKAD
ncbi:MAG TPA: glycosyltransferase family 2 protein [Oligoflexia bacterium]|nr:glycosyltransferase family 2 protein [Oligoflexia bacterium]HMP48845.1 glycosyltransferase family 2 protein [Oligoflexia bacterium]